MAESRQGFKRNEVFQIGQIIESSLTPPGSVRSYLQGLSDASVATKAAQQLKREITAVDVKRIRLQTHGKLAGEGRTDGEAIAALLQTISNQAVEIKRIKDRLGFLEDELLPETRGPQPKHGNGYHPPRPTSHK